MRKKLIYLGLAAALTAGATRSGPPRRTPGSARRPATAPTAALPAARTASGKICTENPCYIDTCTGSPEPAAARSPGRRRATIGR